MYKNLSKKIKIISDCKSVVIGFYSVKSVLIIPSCFFY